MDIALDKVATPLFFFGTVVQTLGVSKANADNAFVLNYFFFLENMIWIFCSFLKPGLKG